MKCRLLTVFSVLLLATAFLSAQSPERFFPRKDLMLSGSYYYPEQWPASQWERDIKKMADMGFEFTHFGEFAWATMEPEEGKYDFTWLDEVVRLAEKHGLKVIMCTPTPAPPAWLTEKYPEVLTVKENGIRMQHGARQQASWSSDVYGRYVEKIVTQLAQRYGKNKAVWGWQIDNEPSHYSAAYDYSDNAQQKFRLWLKEKYGTIQALNESWGNAFWSQTYNTFEQIRIPNGNELPGKANPHAMLDFKRFHADETARFINTQNDILRKYIAPEQWITTNTMPGYSAVDPARMDHLDFLTYTRYLVNGQQKGYGDQGFRISNSHMLSFPNDKYRNFKGVTGVMEIQPGQVNWGTFNPQTYPGAARLWLYHIFAGGNKFVCNYRFRQPLKGNEQYHYGMLQTDGVSISSTGQEFVQVMQEMKTLRKAFDEKASLPEVLKKRKTALLFTPDNLWEMRFQPQTDQWIYRGHVVKYHTQLKSLAVPVDVVDESAPLEDYPFVLAPAFQLLDEALVERWKQYALKGGHLVISCRTGQKNREAHLWEKKLSEPIYELIGGKELFYDHLPSSKTAHVELDGKSYTWNNWADVVSPDGTSEVWASYTDQFFAGKAAVLHKKFGKGSVTFIGADTDKGELEKAVLKKVYTLAGVTTEDLPEGVLMEWRDGFWIGLNYTSDTQTIPVPAKAEILIGQPQLKATGVVVWKDK